MKIDICKDLSRPSELSKSQLTSIRGGLITANVDNPDVIDGRGGIYFVCGFWIYFPLG